MSPQKFLSGASDVQRRRPKNGAYAPFLSLTIYDGDASGPTPHYRVQKITGMTYFLVPLADDFLYLFPHRGVELLRLVLRDELLHLRVRALLH